MSWGKYWKDSARFILSSLSNLVDYITEGIHKLKCKDCNCFLEYESASDDLMKYKWLSCNKDYPKNIVKKLTKQFRNTFKFSNNVINKLILLLWKGVYSYENMDEWNMLHKASLPKK